MENAQQAAGKGLRGDVLRPAHVAHGLEVVFCV
jgi:hypothetical protein